MDYQTKEAIAEIIDAMSNIIDGDTSLLHTGGWNDETEAPELTGYGYAILKAVDTVRIYLMAN